MEIKYKSVKGISKRHTKILYRSHIREHQNLCIRLARILFTDIQTDKHTHRQTNQSKDIILPRFRGGVITLFNILRVKFNIPPISTVANHLDFPQLKKKITCDNSFSLYKLKLLNTLIIWSCSNSVGRSYTESSAEYSSVVFEIKIAIGFASARLISLEFWFIALNLQCPTNLPILIKVRSVGAEI